MEKYEYTIQFNTKKAVATVIVISSSNNYMLLLVEKLEKLINTYASEVFWIFLPIDEWQKSKWSSIRTSGPCEGEDEEA